MGRRKPDLKLGGTACTILVLMAALTFFTVYLHFSVVSKPMQNEDSSKTLKTDEGFVGYDDDKNRDEDCCRGIENLELWGDAVKWGADFKLNSSKDCCLACKGLCGDGNGNGFCLCNSWVFCGDLEACGSQFGECWLKKQKDGLDPERRDSGDKVMWTSGLVFGKGEGIIGLRTEFGVLRIKLLPDCAPHSVSYILELLKLRHCAGCHLYRVESRGRSWDIQGHHIEQASYGPPYALIQGTLKAYGGLFKEITPEACPPIKRGSVAWVGSGPEFFISLANHHEWRKGYTVFGYVIPDDMELVEKIAELPTRPEVWSNVKVEVLENPVPISLQRIESG